MAINEEQQLGRAKNAVLSFLEQRLSVPKIYIDADWDGHHIDVLAINRDGVGDVHAVLLFLRPYFQDGRLDLQQQDEQVGVLLDRFSSIAANYKYIAAVDPEYIATSDNSRWIAQFRVDSYPLLERLRSPDGIGRIGLLHVSEEEPSVEYRLKPERFRAKIAKLADEYVHQHEADWEIRA
ncbi:hypothetical protein [Granulicella sp. dw_53]|uniref:hypothetical protein n=1 Tax=Granulicella sp. dw_53 TaxID=2719792 RepID=UPI001BD2843A|nr:hypothetical protein [Granulicella sp. dw_53]